MRRAPWATNKGLGTTSARGGRGVGAHAFDGAGRMPALRKGEKQIRHSSARCTRANFLVMTAERIEEKPMSVAKNAAFLRCFSVIVRCRH